MEQASERERVCVCVHVRGLFFTFALKCLDVTYSLADGGVFVMCVYLWCCVSTGGGWQPRTCDIRLAEMKKEKQAAKKKKLEEKERRDAEIVELAKEKATKRRQEIKESEKSLAESKERFRRQRERAERKYERVCAVFACLSLRI